MVFLTSGSGLRSETDLIQNTALQSDLHLASGATALFFHNFFTFLGRPGIYLEDLYVKPQARGKGTGQKMLSYLARLAKDRECYRFEWWVLDWNEESIGFYKKQAPDDLAIE